MTHIDKVRQMTNLRLYKKGLEQTYERTTYETLCLGTKEMVRYFLHGVLESCGEINEPGKDNIPICIIHSSILDYNLLHHWKHIGLYITEQQIKVQGQHMMDLLKDIYDNTLIDDPIYIRHTRSKYLKWVDIQKK